MRSCIWVLVYARRCVTLTIYACKTRNPYFTSQGENWIRNYLSLPLSRTDWKIIFNYLRVYKNVQMCWLSSSRMTSWGLVNCADSWLASFIKDDFFKDYKSGSFQWSFIMCNRDTAISIMHELPWLFTQLISRGPIVGQKFLARNNIIQ